MALAVVREWPDVEIVLTARLPLTDTIDGEDEPDNDEAVAPLRQAYFDLNPEVMASLAQIRARMVVTYA